MTASKPGQSGKINRAFNILNSSGLIIQGFNKKNKGHIKNLLSKSFRALSKNLPA